MRDQKKICSVNVLVEILVLLIFPIPWYDTYVTESVSITDQNGESTLTYYLSDILMSIMFLRVWFIFRTWTNYSIHFNAYARNLCKQYGFQSNTSFILRCYFYDKPGQSFLFVFITSVFLLSYLTRIYELPFFRGFGTDSSDLSIFNALWLILMTITTVGYGDISPHTTVGKILCIIAALWGAFLISFLVVVATKLFDLSKTKLKAHKHIILSRSAAITVCKSVKYFLAKKRFYMERIKYKPELITTSPFLKLVVA